MRFTLLPWCWVDGCIIDEIWKFSLQKLRPTFAHQALHAPSAQRAPCAPHAPCAPNIQRTKHTHAHTSPAPSALTSCATHIPRTPRTSPPHAQPAANSNSRNFLLKKSAKMLSYQLEVISTLTARVLIAKENAYT